MSPLTRDELADIRSEASEWLETDVTISRKTFTPDGAGGGGKAWNDVQTVKGRLESESGFEAVIAGRAEADSTTAVVKLPAGTDVLAADRLLIAGQIFEVTFVVRGRVYVLCDVGAIS